MTGRRVFAFVLVLFLAGFAWVEPLRAADSYAIGNGGSQMINEHGVCLVVTNWTGATIFTGGNLSQLQSAPPLRRFQREYCL